MACFAPLDTTISSVPYSSPFSPCNFFCMAALRAAVPTLGV